jgi:membrane protease subunit (stomatin/prohibitin family)
VSRFNDIMGDTMKTLLDLPSQYNELGAGLRASLVDDFANLGLNLKAFYITSITPPEEVQKRIDERSGMGAIGDMNRYLQYQAAQALGGIGQGAAAGGDGGGSDVAGAAGAGLGLGAGMGMGAGMAQIISQSMAGAQQQGQAQQAPALTPVEKLQQLKQMLDAGLITEDIYNAKRDEILAQM